MVTKSLVFVYVCLFYIHRESFPNDLQFTILMRFTVDQTQTPNLKVNVLLVSACVSYIQVERACAKRDEAGGSGTAYLLLPACTFSPPKLPLVPGCDRVAGRLLSCSAALVIPFQPALAAHLSSPSFP